MKYVTVTTNRHTGVYGILHLPSGRMYVGGSVNISSRFTFHRFMLRRGLHKTKELQWFWTRDGEDSFQFKILEKCSIEQLRDCEQRWHDRTPDSFNTLKSVDHSGIKKTSEEKKAISTRAKSMWKRPGYRQEFLNNRTPTGQFRRK